MIAGKSCAVWSTVFSETFCCVAGTSDVKCALRAGEDVDKDIAVYGGGRFARWEMGKIIALVHIRSSVDMLTLVARCRVSLKDFSGDNDLLMADMSKL